MKKIFSKFVLMSFAVAIASGAVMPKKADAYIILGGRLIPSAYEYGRSGAALLGAVNIFLCVSFLPFCLVDGDASDSAISPASLLEQGFSQEEVNLIMKDQSIMTKNLAAMDGQLVVTESDTRETIIQDIKVIHPEASPEYTSFLVEMKGL